MSLAFEVTPEDVWTVLQRMGIQCTLDGSEVQVAMGKVSEEDARITKAALYGNDLDEQTEYALQEIEAVLKEGAGA